MIKGCESVCSLFVSLYAFVGPSIFLLSITKQNIEYFWKYLYSCWWDFPVSEELFQFLGCCPGHLDRMERCLIKYFKMKKPHRLLEVVDYDYWLGDQNPNSFMPTLLYFNFQLFTNQFKCSITSYMVSCVVMKSGYKSRDCSTKVQEFEGHMWLVNPFCAWLSSHWKEKVHEQMNSFDFSAGDEHPAEGVLKPI